jgi:hypothetical protein
MKYPMAVVVILLMGVGGGPAAAACSDSRYSTQLTSAGANTIQDALNDKRILATGGGEEWNEDHCSNGALYKVGVSADDPVDPRAYRGMWGTSGMDANSMVTYNYTVGGSSSFSWTLWQNTTTGGLCWEDSGNIIATASEPEPLSGTCNIP